MSSTEPVPVRENLDAHAVLPEEIPIFCLEATVLLPGEVLSIHVVEPQHREMARQVMAGHHMLGLVASVPAAEGVSDLPPYRQVGCLGFVLQLNDLEDGRLVAWLVGVERFRIENEVIATPYRRVSVTYGVRDEDPRSAGIQPLREELREMLPRLMTDEVPTQSALLGRLQELDDPQLIAVTSQALELTWARKQQLLEAPSVFDRYLLLFEDLYASPRGRRLPDAPQAQLN